MTRPDIEVALDRAKNERHSVVWLEIALYALAQEARVKELEAASRALRDDTTLAPMNETTPRGRIFMNVSQELWNEWCVAIGDLAVPKEPQP